MDSVSLAPLQARSRQTRERLLTATLAIIEEKGIAGVTIPTVAAAAGLSPGSVYRRFDDKEAMIRIAFLRFLESSQDTNQASLGSDRLRALTLEGALLAITRGLVAQYRGRTGLLKALDQYLEVQADATFRDRAVSIIEANLQLVIGALLPFHDRIAAADPERGITFALLSAITVIEAHKLHHSPVWSRVFPLDDDGLAAETARAMTAYLTKR
jgi:AcrR family transcriptional regulator